MMLKDFRRPQSVAEECEKLSLMMYSDSWEYCCTAWKCPEYEKLDEWMSVDMENGYRLQIS